MPAVLTIEQAAEYLATSVRHVRGLIYERRIPYSKVGRFPRFMKDDLDAWLASTRVEVRRR